MDAPARWVSRIATQAHGLPTPIGLRQFYALVGRGVELELISAGLELGVCWRSPEQPSTSS